jgi:hypothetical protein
VLRSLGGISARRKPATHRIGGCHQTGLPCHCHNHLHKPNIAEPEGFYSANEELAKIEVMSPHPREDAMARRLSVKHGQLLKDWRTSS